MATDPGPATHDTEPQAPHVTTDPGLGVVVAPVVGVDRNAVTEPEAESPTPVGDVVPSRAERVAADRTPVPPETDGLLNGLIAGESEAYFHRTKASAQSSGEAAAAFHGAARPVAPGNPTPPPEPAVLLRRSVELELQNPLPAPPQDAVVPPARDTVPPVRGRSTEPRIRTIHETFSEPTPEPTVPLPMPRSIWNDRAVAFGLALLAAGAIGIIAVRVMGDGDTPPPGVTEGTPPAPTAVTVAPPVTAQAAPSPAIPPPPPVATEPATPPIDTATAQPAAPDQTGRPAKAARPNPAAKRGPPPSAAPTEVLPPPKDDVKRSM